MGRGFSGGGMDDALVDPLNYTVEILSGQNYAAIGTNLQDMVTRSIECTDMPMQYVSMEQRLASIEDSRNHNNTEDNRYTYHSDHLGSSSFLTDASGIPTQHLQYLPFGEPFIDQRTDDGYATPYTFSAKERDPETGYSYFGARYYSSNLSIWLSVDPLSDKYPSMSAYMYCAGNPVKLVDPDGREITGEGGIDPTLSESSSSQSDEGTYYGNGNYRHVEPPENPAAHSVPSTNAASPETQTANRALPSFSKLESNYPKYGPQYQNNGVSDLDFAKKVGGKVQTNIESGNFSNTCALRVPYALVESGETLPHKSGAGNSSSDRNGKWLYPRLGILEEQLNKLTEPLKYQRQLI